MNELFDKIDELKAERRSAENRVSEEASALTAAEKEVIDREAAGTILQIVAQNIQQRLHEKMTEVVNKCLRTVFDDPYEFKIVFERKRGKTEANPVFERDGAVFDDPKNEIGGGVIDVAALALRVSRLMLSKPRLRRILILDEPFKNIRGLENRKRVRKMLEKLSEELDMQIVLNVDLDAYPEFGLGEVVELC